MTILVNVPLDFVICGLIVPDGDSKEHTLLL